MSLNCAIVGLPNVGKSTLFNTLLQKQEAEAANYPFCTIEPSKALVAVVDERLKNLAKLAGSKEIIYSQIGITDVAGLVAGASKGEGLGNQFLAHIREEDAIIHVVRLFCDNDIIHVNNKVDPLHDKEVIETELMLSDLESLAKRLPKMERSAKGDKDALKELDFAKDIIKMLEDGKMPTLWTKELSEEDKAIVKKLQLITTKPMVYVCNVSESEFVDDKYKNNVQYIELCNIAGDKNIVVMPIKFESDFIGMSDEERDEYMQACGIKGSTINSLIKKCYQLLNLHSFFTVGPKEAHAWDIPLNTNAKRAAAAIHSDIEHGFIKAEVISYDDYIKYGSESEARTAGRLRSEGKDYIVEDGDVINFLHSN